MKKQNASGDLGDDISCRDVAHSMQCVQTIMQTVAASSCKSYTGQSVLQLAFNNTAKPAMGG